MFTKLHDRRIPNVRVGVGPMEFKLNYANVGASTSLAIGKTAYTALVL